MGKKSFYLLGVLLGLFNSEGRCGESLERFLEKKLYNNKQNEKRERIEIYPGINFGGLKDYFGDSSILRIEDENFDSLNGEYGQSSYLNFSRNMLRERRFFSRNNSLNERIERFEREDRREISTGVSELVYLVESLEKSDLGSIIPGIGDAVVFTASVVRNGYDTVRSINKKIYQKCDNTLENGKNSAAGFLEKNGVLNSSFSEYIRKKVGVRSVFELRLDDFVNESKAGLLVDFEAGIGSIGVGVYGGSDSGVALNYGLTF